MSALSEMIRTQKSTPLGAIIIAVAANGDSEYAEQAASELAQLRADNAALREAVNEARIAIDDALDTMDMEGVGHGNAGQLCRAWLAANPADEVKA